MHSNIKKNDTYCKDISKTENNFIFWLGYSSLYSCIIRKSPIKVRKVCPVSEDAQRV